MKTVHDDFRNSLEEIERISLNDSKLISRTKITQKKEDWKVSEHCKSLNDYQDKASRTDTYKEGLFPVVLGLGEESGEVLGKIKKVYRDQNGVFTTEKIEELKKELGDVLWYLAIVSKRLGLTLQQVADSNIEKLASRKERGTINGSGDNR